MTTNKEIIKELLNEFDLNDFTEMQAFDWVIDKHNISQEEIEEVLKEE